MARSSRVRFVLALMVIINITTSTSTAFFSIYATKDLAVAEALLAYFPMLRSGIMLLFIFTIQTMLNRLPYRVPMSLGLILYIVAQLLLVLAPPQQLVVLFAYIAFEAFAHALVIPHRDTLLARFVSERERARMLSLIYISVIALTSPFGYIAGRLSHLDRRLPFVLNLLLYALCFALIQFYREPQHMDGEGEPAEASAGSP